MTDGWDEIAAKARFYAEEIADCTCEDNLGETCWYHLTGKQRIRRAFEYALEGE